VVPFLRQELDHAAAGFAAHIDEAFDRSAAAYDHLGAHGQALKHLGADSHRRILGQAAFAGAGLRKGRSRTSPFRATDLAR
jgi:hypothetical protein